MAAQVVSSKIPYSSRLGYTVRSQRYGEQGPLGKPLVVSRKVVLVLLSRKSHLLIKRLAKVAGSSSSFGAAASFKTLLLLELLGRSAQQLVHVVLRREDRASSVSLLTL